MLVVYILRIFLDSNSCALCLWLTLVLPTKNLAVRSRIIRIRKEVKVVGFLGQEVLRRHDPYTYAS